MKFSTGSRVTVGGKPGKVSECAPNDNGTVTYAVLFDDGTEECFPDVALKAATNADTFRMALEAAYTKLFLTPEYAYSAYSSTPAKLAAKMTTGLMTGSANHDGAGIRAACKAVGIKPTRKAILAFLNA